MKNINDTKLLSDLLKNVLINNEETKAVPELSDKIPELLEAINHYPVIDLISEEIITSLDKAFKNYYSTEINGWVFCKVYTRNEKPNMIYNNKKTNRIEFTKEIRNEELIDYINKFQEKGFNEEETGKLKTLSPYGLELNYESTEDKARLTISTLLKTKHVKDFINTYLI